VKSRSPPGEAVIGAAAASASMISVSAPIGTVRRGGEA
jgi:hypothetical protein